MVTWDKWKLKECRTINISQYFVHASSFDCIQMFKEFGMRIPSKLLFRLNVILSWLTLWHAKTLLLQWFFSELFPLTIILHTAISFRVFAVHHCPDHHIQNFSVGKALYGSSENDETLAIWISKGFLFYVRPFCMHFYSILTIHKLS